MLTGFDKIWDGWMDSRLQRSLNLSHTRPFWSSKKLTPSEAWEMTCLRGALEDVYGKGYRPDFFEYDEQNHAIYSAKNLPALDAPDVPTETSMSAKPIWEEARDFAKAREKRFKGKGSPNDPIDQTIHFIALEASKIALLSGDSAKMQAERLRAFQKAISKKSNGYDIFRTEYEDSSHKGGIYYFLCRNVGEKIDKLLIKFSNKTYSATIADRMGRLETTHGWIRQDVTSFLAHIISDGKLALGKNFSDDSAPPEIELAKLFKTRFGLLLHDVFYYERVSPLSGKLPNMPELQTSSAFLDKDGKANEDYVNFLWSGACAGNASTFEALPPGFSNRLFEDKRVGKEALRKAVRVCGLLKLFDKYSFMLKSLSDAAQYGGENYVFKKVPDLLEKTLFAASAFHRVLMRDMSELADFVGTSFSCESLRDKDSMRLHWEESKKHLANGREHANSYVVEAFNLLGDYQKEGGAREEKVLSNLLKAFDLYKETVDELNAILPADSKISASLDDRERANILQSLEEKEKIPAVRDLEIIEKKAEVSYLEPQRGVIVIDDDSSSIAELPSATEYLKQSVSATETSALTQRSIASDTSHIEVVNASFRSILDTSGSEWFGSMLSKIPKADSWFQGTKTRFQYAKHIERTSSAWKARIDRLLVLRTQISRNQTICQTQAEMVAEALSAINTELGNIENRMQNLWLWNGTAYEFLLGWKTQFESVRARIEKIRTDTQTRISNQRQLASATSRSEVGSEQLVKIQQNQASVAGDEKPTGSIFFVEQDAPTGNDTESAFPHSDSSVLIGIPEFAQSQAEANQAIAEEDFGSPLSTINFASKTLDPSRVLRLGKLAFHGEEGVREPDLDMAKDCFFWLAENAPEGSDTTIVSLGYLSNIALANDKVGLAEGYAQNRAKAIDYALDMRSDSEARKLLINMRDNEHLDAKKSFVLGKMAYEGRGGARNLDLSYKCFSEARQALDIGSLEHIVAIGRLVKICKKNQRKAEAKQLMGEQNISLEKAFSSFDDDGTADPQKGKAELLAKVRLDSWLPAFWRAMLGKMYRDGHGISADFSLAKECFCSALREQKKGSDAHIDLLCDLICACEKFRKEVDENNAFVLLDASIDAALKGASKKDSLKLLGRLYRKDRRLLNVNYLVALGDFSKNAAYGKPDLTFSEECYLTAYRAAKKGGSAEIKIIDRLISVSKGRSKTKELGYVRLREDAIHALEEVAKISLNRKKGRELRQLLQTLFLAKSELMHAGRIYKLGSMAFFGEAGNVDLVLAEKCFAEVSEQAGEHPHEALYALGFLANICKKKGRTLDAELYEKRQTEQFHKARGDRECLTKMRTFGILPASLSIVLAKMAYFADGGPRDLDLAEQCFSPFLNMDGEIDLHIDALGFLARIRHRQGKSIEARDFEERRAASIDVALDSLGKDASFSLLHRLHEDNNCPLFPRHRLLLAEFCLSRSSKHLWFFARWSFQKKMEDAAVEHFDAVVREVSEDSPLWKHATDSLLTLYGQRDQLDLQRKTECLVAKASQREQKELSKPFSKPLQQGETKEEQESIFSFLKGRFQKGMLRSPLKLFSLGKMAYFGVGCSIDLVLAESCFAEVSEKAENPSRLLSYAYAFGCIIAKKSDCHDELSKLSECRDFAIDAVLAREKKPSEKRGYLHKLLDANQLGKKHCEMLREMAQKGIGGASDVSLVFKCNKEILYQQCLETRTLTSLSLEKNIDLPAKHLCRFGWLCFEGKGGSVDKSLAKKAFEAALACTENPLTDSERRDVKACLREMSAVVSEEKEELVLENEPEHEHLDGALVVVASPEHSDTFNAGSVLLEQKPETGDETENDNNGNDPEEEDNNEIESSVENDNNGNDPEEEDNNEIESSVENDNNGNDPEEEDNNETVSSVENDNNELVERRVCL